MPQSVKIQKHNTFNHQHLPQKRIQMQLPLHLFSAQLNVILGVLFGERIYHLPLYCQTKQMYSFLCEAGSMLLQLEEQHCLTQYCASL